MPKLLLEIPDAPGLLRVLGAVGDGPYLAIVGTRRCSNAGLAMAERFADTSGPRKQFTNLSRRSDA